MVLENISSIAKCEFCGKVGYRRSFFGRFCSKVCIGRHAVAARKQMRSKNSYGRQKVEKRTQKPFQRPSTAGELKHAVGAEAAAKPFQFNSDTIIGRSHFKKRSFREIMIEMLSDFVSFNWESYLTEENAVGLDDKKFELITGRNAYPTKQNPFKEGQHLEVVDPMHQSLICLSSVVQTEGLRMRLHFDNYHECFDFWIDADSPFIFPRGFCDKTKRQLRGLENDIKPITYDDQTFSEVIYTNATQFKRGDKLEAVDRKHHDLICVATIADIIADNVLIHFDGWEKDYDYWADSSSPFIHPVGWCAANGKPFSSPPGHDSPFVWPDYLKTTSSTAADVSCFQTKEDKFQNGMKLEVVDQRNPILIRVATIVDVNELQIKVHFDGWDTIYDDWLDVDSRDIHPVNWCHYAGYPLHPPVDESKILKKLCPVLGCPSLGHVNSSKQFAYHKKHYSVQGCPYSHKNMNKNDVFVDRLTGSSAKSQGSSQQVADDAFKKTAKRTRFAPNKKRPATLRHSFGGIYNRAAKHFPHQESKRLRVSRMKESTNSSFIADDSSNDRVSSKVKSVREQAIRSSVAVHEQAIRSSVASSLASLSSMHLPHCWDKNVKHLPGVDGIKANDVMKWDVTKVATFVTTLTGKLECGTAFEREEVDGEALLLLSQNDILNTLKLKLGPAVKVFNAILFFKVHEKSHFS